MRTISESIAVLEKWREGAVTRSYTLQSGNFETFAMFIAFDEAKKPKKLFSVFLGNLKDALDKAASEVEG